MREVRKEVIFFKRGYKIDELGVLYNPKGNVVGKGLNGQGYPRVNIRVNGDKIYVLLHRLQAYKKFGEKIFEEGIVVRHKDGNKCNNSWDNILIGTHSDNMMDIEETVRFNKAKYAASFNIKYDAESIKAFYNECKSYKKTIEKFNLKGKSSLRYILKNR